MSRLLSPKKRGSLQSACMSVPIHSCVTGPTWYPTRHRSAFLVHYPLATCLGLSQLVRTTHLDTPHGFRSYAYMFDCNLDVIEPSDPTHYAGLGEVFYRKLKPSVRPCGRFCLGKWSNFRITSAAPYRQTGPSSRRHNRCPACGAGQGNDTAGRTALRRNVQTGKPHITHCR